MKKNINISMKLLNNISFLTGFSLFLPLETAYFNSLGFSSLQITTLNLSLPLFMGIMEIPTGYLSDKVKRKKITVFSTLFLLLSMFVLTLSGNIHFIFLAYFLEGIGWSLASGNNESLIMELVDSEEMKFNKALSKYYEYSFFASVLCSIILVISTNLKFENIKV